MASVINPDFGDQNPNPSAEAVALDKLKWTISLLPDLSVNLAPPDVLDPHVINVKQAQFQIARQMLGVRFDMLNAAYQSLKAMDMHPTSAFKLSFAALLDDVLRLQDTLSPSKESPAHESLANLLLLYPGPGNHGADSDHGPGLC